MAGRPRSHVGVRQGHGSLNEIKPVTAGRESIGVGEAIFAAPQPAFADAWYAWTSAQLSRLAQSPPAAVSLVSDDGGATVYEAWQVDPRVLNQFLEATGFTPSDP